MQQGEIVLICSLYSHLFPMDIKETGLFRKKALIIKAFTLKSSSGIHLLPHLSNIYSFLYRLFRKAAFSLEDGWNLCVGSGKSSYNYTFYPAKSKSDGDEIQGENTD